MSRTRVATPPRHARISGMRGASENVMVETVEMAAGDEARRGDGGDGLGIASFVTGCLGLGPVAIVLGGFGLARWRDGRASRRSWPLAGLVLGVVGTVLIVTGTVLHLVSERSEGAVRAHAEVDVIGIGNAVVEQLVTHPDAAAVAVEADADAYLVGDLTVPRTVGDAVTVAYAGTSASDWCVTLTTGAAGEVGVAYGATAGLLEECPAG